MNRLVYYDGKEMKDQLTIDYLKSNAAAVQESHIFWLDFEKPENDEISFLSENLNLSSFLVEKVVGRANYPTLSRCADYLFISVPVLERDIKGILSTKHMYILLHRNFIITIHWRKMETLEYMLGNIGERLDDFKHGSGMILFSLIEKSAAKISFYLEEMKKSEVLRNRLDIDLSEENSSLVCGLKEEIFDADLSVTGLRRIVENILSEGGNLLSDKNRACFKDLYFRLENMMHTVSALNSMYGSRLDFQMLSRLSKQELSTRYAYNYILVTLPLLIISNIFSMNFTHMKEYELKYGYYIVLTIMFLFAVGQIFYINRKTFKKFTKKSPKKHQKNEEIPSDAEGKV